MAETVWTFKTQNFTVRLRIEPDDGYEYDGDDPDGETQAKLDSGDYVAFDSRVDVFFRGDLVGTDMLGGSVYDADDVSDFWTAHRTSPANQRNTLDAKSRKVVYCHYFPSMVSEAIKAARNTMRDMQAVYIRGE